MLEKNISWYMLFCDIISS